MDLPCSLSSITIQELLSVFPICTKFREPRSCNGSYAPGDRLNCTDPVSKLVILLPRATTESFLKSDSFCAGCDSLLVDLKSCEGDALLLVEMMTLQNSQLNCLAWPLDMQSTLSCTSPWQEMTGPTKTGLWTGIKALLCATSVVPKRKPEAWHQFEGACLWNNFVGFLSMCKQCDNRAQKDSNAYLRL